MKPKKKKKKTLKSSIVPQYDCSIGTFSYRRIFPCRFVFQLESIRRENFNLFYFSLDDKYKYVNIVFVNTDFNGKIIFHQM